MLRCWSSRHRIAASSLLAALAILFPLSALAEKRVALVIGNSSYAKVVPLPNPVRDAAAVEALLKGAGFEVTRVTNAGGTALRRAIRDFSNQVRDADIAAVFYAGHGMEVNGTNYLVPVDAVLERDIDIEDEAITLDRLSQLLEPAKRLRLIILDACRDNPFVRSMKRTLANRSIGRGLAKIDVLTSDMLVAYSARAGSTAEDGAGTNSPYTAALLKHLTTPGLDLRIAFGRVRDEVLKVTENRQEPFVYGSLGGDEVALVAGADNVARPVSPTPPKPATEPPNTAIEPARTAIEHGWLGVKVTTLEGKDIPRGQARVKITEVLPGSPAEAKLRADDNIVRIDGKYVANTRDFVSAVSAHKGGDEVELLVRRGPDGDRREVRVVVTLGRHR